MSENTRKIKLLKMWEILKTETDEEHPMSTPELIERLAKEGIPVDRKILYSDIELLNDYGYEVLKETDRSNKYFVEDRSFNPSEVRFLIDAVRSSAFITEKKTEELINKIAMLAGSQRGNILKENITKALIVKGTNEIIYYSVDTIVNAIKKKRKIGFNYFDHDEKGKTVYRKDKEDPSKNKWYVVNPVSTVIDNGQYYLVCYDDKHEGKLANYRIDRMDKVEMLDEPITKNNKIAEDKKRKQFEMFGGEPKTVEFIAERNLLEVFLDKFGKNIKIRTTDEGKLRCTVDVEQSPIFINWCCSFGNRLTVISPPSTIGLIKDHLAETIAQYEDK
ncbi:MAG: WYL domain-containing protein [Clostridia bacterium]|nr:WYL domain-containing protein [Clostridia bacterium]